MAVYVDSAENRVGRMKMCHLLADTPDELFAMVDKIGVSRRWYQPFGKASCPHFDIAKSKRGLAVIAGAVEVDRRELVRVKRRIIAAAFERVCGGRRHGWEPELH